jgi:hypothetical protein
MQPCEVCGGMGIDAGGYCTTCRTYRGVPSAPAPQGYSVIPPVSGTPYQGSGVPYADPTSGSPYGAPMGGMPGYPGPTSGGPYPNYGGGYPPSPEPGYPAPGGYQPANFLPPPTPPRSRSSFVVPLIALSVTLVVLVVGIVAVAALRKKDTPLAGPSGSASASAKPSPIVDTCVVGLWNATEETQDVPVEGVGSVRVTGSGMKVRLRADGTGAYEFSDTTYTATISGHRVDIIVNGTTKYDYRTSNGSMAFSNFSNSGTVTVKVDGAAASSEALTEDADPVRYSCSGSTLTQTTSLRSVTLSKISSSP